MRAWKHLALALAGALALVGVLGLGQSMSAYYRFSQFDHYLQHEIWRTRVTPQLKQALLDKARAYSLSVQEDNIKITSSGGVFRVDVNYRVPINLFIYEHDLRFHSIGAGLLRE